MVTPVIDTSEVEENALIQAQLDGSVQEFPDAKTNKSGTLGWGVADLFQRHALLSPRGTQERLRMQRSWYYHEDNTMFRSIVSGLTKRLQSLPYEIKEYGTRWDDFIRYSNFDNWENFLSELIIAYSVFDIGAFVEIIAAGNPMTAPAGAATGIAILDSRRCFLTGDPMFPVVYVAANGKQHLMHRARVVQFADMEERNEEMPDWGDSALSRCITPIFREILMAQYMRASLDDMPAPGFAIAKNLTEQQVMQQIGKMKDKRENDQDMLGRLVFLYGADTSQVPNLEFTQFQKEFTGFDPDKLSNMNAKYMASGTGVDIQDFWELSGRGIGTATQSEVLAEKSKGRALGRLIKGIERMVNDVVPDDVEFTFKYRNEEEDLERAQTAQAWANTLETLTILSPDDAVKDGITDEQGNILRWDDVDPQSLSQARSMNDLASLMNQTEGGNQSAEVQPVSGESVVTLNKLVIDQMNRAMIDVFTAAQLLGNKHPAEELRGMFWVGNQLVPQDQLQNIWKYGTLIAPSTTNADLIVETEPEVLDTDETDNTPSAPPSPVQPSEMDTTGETPDENFDAAIEKDYRRTAKRFRETFNEVIKLMREGITSPASVRVILLDELRRGGRFAYLDGLKRAGKRKPSFDENGERALATWLSKQRPLVSSFVTSIMEGKFSDKQL
ncbi:MAG: hypothetical protein ACYTBJ_27345, partial [Planctomycetota bacterium]